MTCRWRRVNQIQPIYVSIALPQNNLPELRAAMAKGPVTVQVHARRRQRRADHRQDRLLRQHDRFDLGHDQRAQHLRQWRSAAVARPVRECLGAGAHRSQRAGDRARPRSRRGRTATYVFVIKDDNTAEARPVTVDRTVGGIAVICEGTKRRREGRDRRPAALEQRHPRPDCQRRAKGVTRHEPAGALHPSSGDDDAADAGLRHLRSVQLSAAAGRRDPARSIFRPSS